MADKVFCTANPLTAITDSIRATVPFIYSTYACRDLNADVSRRHPLLAGVPTLETDYTVVVLSLST